MDTQEGRQEAYSHTRDVGVAQNAQDKQNMLFCPIALYPATFFPITKLVMRHANIWVVCKVGVKEEDLLCSTK